MLDFMLCILKQSDHIQREVAHVIFNKFAGTFAEFPLSESRAIELLGALFMLQTFT